MFMPWLPSDLSSFWAAYSCDIPGKAVAFSPENSWRYKILYKILVYGLQLRMPAVGGIIQYFWFWFYIH